MPYEEEDTCVIHSLFIGTHHVCMKLSPNDNACHMRRRILVSYEEEDTCMKLSPNDNRGYMCHMRRRILVSYEEEDTCVI